MYEKNKNKILIIVKNIHNSLNYGVLHNVHEMFLK